MLSVRTGLCAALVASGCGSTSPGRADGCEAGQATPGRRSSPILLSDYFPFDGLRSWEYANPAPSMPHTLLGTMRSEVDQVGDASVYTIDFTFGDRRQWSSSWSSTSFEGVHIHGYTLGGGPEVKLDPPLQVAPPWWSGHEKLSTPTGGTTFTSELLCFQPCPVQMGVDWGQCLRFEVTSEDGPVPPLTGTFWANWGFNIVGMELPWNAGHWGLQGHECSDCNGDW